MAGDHPPPIVLGEGIPLFASASRQDSLKPTDTQTYANGIVLLSYEPMSSPT